MQCPMKTGQSSELALEYMGGRLEAEAARALERHYEECPACREYFAAGRAVQQALDDWRPPAISPDFDRRLEERIKAEEARGGWWRSLLAPFAPGAWKPAAALAGLAVILLAAALLKAPAPLGRETARGAPESVDVEQVEQVVEDLDMLYLLDPVVLDEADEPAGAAEPDKVGSLSGADGRVKCV